MNVNYKRDCKAAPGEYVEAEVDREVTNTNEPRTHSCLCLGPSGNRQGSYKCLDIDTNKLVVRRILHVIPMPDDVMRKVNALGKRGARAIERGNITFRNRKGDKFSWENDTFDDLVVVNEEKKIYPEVAAEIPSVPLQEEVDSDTKSTDFKDDALSLRAPLAKAGANANPADRNGR